MGRGKKSVGGGSRERARSRILISQGVGNQEKKENNNIFFNIKNTEAGTTTAGGGNQEYKVLEVQTPLPPIKRLDSVSERIVSTPPCVPNLGPKLNIRQVLLYQKKIGHLLG